MAGSETFDPEVDRLLGAENPGIGSEQAGEFDEALFGMLLRKLRTDRGYKTAEELSKALKKETGLSITPQTLYRIEKGTRSITYPEFLAYSLLFFGELDGSSMERYMRLCVPPAWASIDERTQRERFEAQHPYGL